MAGGKRLSPKELLAGVEGGWTSNACEEGPASGSVEAAYKSADDYAVGARTHDLYSLAEGSYPEWLLAQLPREGVRAVLDVGCGTGAVLRRMAAAGIGGRWLGVDQSEAMVQQAQTLADEARLPIEATLAQPPQRLRTRLCKVAAHRGLRHPTSAQHLRHHRLVVPCDHPSDQHPQKPFSQPLVALHHTVCQSASEIDPPSTPKTYPPQFA